MLNNLAKKSWIAGLLIASMTGMSLYVPVAEAGMIPTQNVFENSVADSDQIKVTSFLAREDVRKQLQALGVDPTQAAERAQRLSNEQAQQLAAQIDTLPAGGDIVGALVFIFIVLLITDILGLTRVFPFTRPAR